MSIWVEIDAGVVRWLEHTTTQYLWPPREHYTRAEIEAAATLLLISNSRGF
jgi:hypothetical protein